MSKIADHNPKSDENLTSGSTLEDLDGVECPVCGDKYVRHADMMTHLGKEHAE